MDYDYSENWLGFSLSNTNTNFFHNNTITTTPSEDVSIDRSDNDYHHHGEQDAAASSFVPSTGPKLEDFLGGCAAVEQTPTCVYQVSDEFTTSTATLANNYASTSRSFLHGFPDQQLIINDDNAITITNTFHKQQRQLEGSSSSVPPAKKAAAADTFGHRTSIYRGVTRHRWTGRYEAHLWDNSCRREGQTRKGRQVYLGGYDKEEKAAIAYDLAAIKYWGSNTTTNFPMSSYEKELEEMKNMNRQEFVASLRRKSSGFSRGASIYRGVTRHHQHGRWQARIGRVAGNKDLYLGTFSTQEEAAEAYDIAAIKFRGLNAVTNFDMNRYDVKSIAHSNLPIGGLSGKSKTSSPDQLSVLSNDPNSSCPNVPSQNPMTTPNLTLSLPQFQNSNEAAFTPFEMVPSNQVSSYGGFNIGQYHSDGALSNDPFETNISLNRSSNEEEYSSYFNSWIVAPSPHLLQTSAKPNLSVFQTSVFGMK